jgi:putative peptide zinc metalloprotease protein
MTALHGPVARPAEEQACPAPVRGTDAGALRRADGVQLLGEMKGSGYRATPALARRSDGQVVQLTPLLYRVLEAVDERRTLDEVAERVSAAAGRTVTADNVRTLVDGRLRPAGLMVAADGSQPELRKANPLLALRFKYAVTDPERTRRLTAPFAVLFAPIVVVAVLVAFLAVCWWVLWEKGLASATSEAFDKPFLLLLVLAVTVFSAGFHEFGHAAAARRGGATPGAMGAGIYLVWPAFYTDVTDSYRLGRAGRIRTDLGGLYFNAIIAVVITGLWWATGYDALLLVVATQILQMLRQLTPLVRFDGYHVLADITGVPDLFHRIGPTLRGLLPWYWRDPEAKVLKPWARAVVTAWVLVVVPMLAFSAYILVTALPRLLGTAWAALTAQGGMLADAWSRADPVGVGVRGVAVLAVLFPVFAVAVLLVRAVGQLIRATLRRTRERPLLRALVGLVAIALLGGLAWAWWPHPGAYRPVQPYEGGTLQQAGANLGSAIVPGRETALTAGRSGRVAVMWPAADPRPTAAHPQLALVLVPHGYDTSNGAPATRTTGGGPGIGQGGVAPPAQAWVFPFDKPLQPGPGDNQALAVATTDGTVVYDVAFALVWVEADTPALSTNEAYAFASCTDCAAVSVGFQVVFVVGDNHVAAPQNISAAVNYDCVNCLTYALATQLFVTLDGPLSDAAMQDMTRLWARIAEYGTHIAEAPIGEIQAQLTAFEQEILQIVEKDQGPLTPAPVATSPAGGAAQPTAPAAPTADSVPSGAPPTGATDPVLSATAVPPAPPEEAPAPAEAGPAPAETVPTSAAVEAPSTSETDPPPTSPPAP